MRQNTIDIIGYVAATCPTLSLLPQPISILVLTLRFDRNVVKEVTGV